MSLDKLFAALKRRWTPGDEWRVRLPGGHRGRSLAQRNHAKRWGAPRTPTEAAESAQRATIAHRQAQAKAAAERAARLAAKKRPQDQGRKREVIP